MKLANRRLRDTLLAACAALLLLGPGPRAAPAPAPVSSKLLRSKNEAVLEAKVHQSPRMRAALRRAVEEAVQGRHAQALAVLRAAPATSDADRLARRVTVADVQSDWGNSLERARPAEAIPHFEAALVTDRADRPQKVPASLGEIGHCYARSGRYAQAVTAYRQGIAAAEQIKVDIAQSVEANLLDGLGEASLGHGQPGLAADSFRAALSLCRKAGDPIGKAAALDGLGRAAVALRRPAQALTPLRQSLALVRQYEGLMGEARALRLNEAGVLDHLGEAYAALHRPALALGHYQEALRLTRQAESGAAADVRDLTAGAARQTDPADRADDAAGLREPANTLAEIRADFLPRLQADIAAARRGGTVQGGEAR